jgi:D-glycero-D-manno-heptose 1,7-bisphosphate phosphatase
MGTASGMRGTRKAILLDRDGVINVKLPENCYVTDPSEFTFMPGAIEALSILQELGYLLVVVTNQRGIARGMQTDDCVHRVHEHMRNELGKFGVRLARIYYCPHDISDNCGCRKPQPGMIIQAGLDLDLDLAQSYMVGDASSDVAAGRNAGTRTARLGFESDHDADLAVSGLLDFALFLKKQHG